MSKPQSIKIQPWTDFPKLPSSYITDDFVHDKLAVVKVNAKGEKSTANVKLSVSEDKGAKNISDEIKVWFGLSEGRSLYSKIKSSDYVKVLFDNGVSEHWGRKWNIYAGVNTTKSLTNISLRVGAAHLSSKCHSDNRLKVDFNGDNKNLTWYNRTVVNQDKFTFGVLGAYGISNNVLVKNSLLFGYNHDGKTSAYLRIENDGYRKTGFNWADFSGYFDSLRLSVVSEWKDWGYGFEANLRTRGQLFNQASLVVDHEFPHKVNFKGSFSTNFSASLAFKFPAVIFKDIAKTSVGVHGHNLNDDKKRDFKYGIQVEFNV